MGKHERQLIKKAEIIVTKILNDKPLSKTDERNLWLHHSQAIAKQIKKDYSNLASAQHLGNRYDNTGDILIKINKKVIIIELKMSDSQSGVGTKANLSQDALTENFLFFGNVMSWRQFRLQRKHERWVNKYLDLYRKYPKNILNITNVNSHKEAKARFLRDLKKKDTKAAAVLNRIQKRDRQEKLDYLTYLSQHNQNKEMVKKFFILITLGIHQKEVLKVLIKQDDIFREAQNLFVYYSNLRNQRVIVRKENVGERIQEILARFSLFKIIFPKNVTNSKLVGIQENKEVALLQIVLHWKNIAQGIKTPCLNIFDLTVK